MLFRSLYERLVDWPRRLQRETPFYRRLFDARRSRRLLDCACGLGHHAALFADWGLDVTGADISPAMIARPADAHPPRPHLRWTVASFAGLPFRDGAFDMVVCVGNSLAMPASLSAVADALAEMARVLAPGGLMILHILNAWSRPDGVVEVQKILPIDLAGRRALLVKQFCRHGRFAAITLLQLAPADTEPSSPDPAGPPSSRNADAPAAPWVCIDQQTHPLAAIDPD